MEKYVTMYKKESVLREYTMANTCDCFTSQFNLLCLIYPLMNKRWHMYEEICESTLLCILPLHNTYDARRYHRYVPAAPTGQSADTWIKHQPALCCQRQPFRDLPADRLTAGQLTERLTGGDTHVILTRAMHAWYSFYLFSFALQHTALSVRQCVLLLG